jgi:hypothetical protein
MATLESVRTLLATFYAYHDKDFGEVVFDRILIVEERVLLTGRRGADRFTSVFSVDDGGVRRVEDYASVDAALDALKTTTDVSDGDADLPPVLEMLDPGRPRHAPPRPSRPRRVLRAPDAPPS